MSKQERSTALTAVSPLAPLLGEPLVVIDVGCREGEARGWGAFDPAVRVVGFEPDGEECRRLEAEYEGPENRLFVPVALGARSGEATLHLTRHPQSSSLYAPDPDVIARHPALRAHEQVGERTVALTTLDAWSASAGLERADFMKIDVQGAELDVLRGGERLLTSVRALQVEVEFQALYRGQPLFYDVDAHLRQRGFALWRLRDMVHVAIEGTEHDPDRSVPFTFAGETEILRSGGRLAWADAVYVREDLGDDAGADPLRDALVAAALDLPELVERALTTAVRAGGPAADAAAEALERFRSRAEGAHGTLLELVRAREEANNNRLAAQERLEKLEELERNRQWAVREADLLRERLDHVERWGGARPTIGTQLATPVREARARARMWVAPRLGRLRHHGPQPVRVPRAQLSLRPPRSAPSISIVTPSFNQGHFIERTIRSVLAQDYPRLEYRVQDAGSRDATPAILEAYRDRLAGVAIEPDDGQADGINRAFARTSGEVMAWLNSDDMLLPGALAAVSRHFARHPETDVVYGHRLLVDEDDQQVGAWILPPHDDEVLAWVDLVPQETLFWRRSVWEAVGGRLDERYHYALDWDLLLRFRDAGARMVRLPLPLGAFRVHRDQKTSAHLEAGLLEMARLRRRGGGRGVDTEEAWRMAGGYLRRHVRSHTLYRTAMRIPGFAAEVRLGH